MHRNTFSPDEIRQIEKLIQKKLTASDTQQKSIRNSIRAIGFYWSDFHPKDEFPKVPYNIENFRKLIADGCIKVSDASIGLVNYERQTTPKATVKMAIANTQSDNFKQSLPPWVGDEPQILILGTMPGDMSLKMQSYYCNPSNSFWPVMYSIFGKSNDQLLTKKEFITSKGIALWDCLSSGVREGSMDTGFDDDSLTGNDIQSFLNEHPTIHSIVLNGSTKTVELYKKYCNVTSDVKVFILPSTASYISLQQKIQKWTIVKSLLKQ